MSDLRPTPPPVAPLDEISAFITYVSRLATSDAVRRRVAGAAERLVTPAESAALRAVADAGPVTFKGLAEHLELDQTTISRTANRLLEVGLVARETDPDDRRKAWLSITADGDEMLHRLQHVATQWYEVAISEWTPEEQRALGDALARFRHDLQRLEFDGEGRAVALARPTDDIATPDPSGGVRVSTQDHYTIISADTHAGANHETYREYLDPKYLDDFDAWRNKYKNPWKDLRDTDLRVRNWDDDRRDRDQLADGVVGEVIFPNTVPPFYPGFVLFAGPPQARRVRAPARRHPRAQPVDGRLLRPQARAARRHRPVLPQRRRRRDRGRHLDQGARPARRRAAAERRARREVGASRSTTRSTTRSGRPSRSSSSR